MDAKTNGALDVLKRIGQYVPNDEFAAYFEAREALEELHKCNEVTVKAFEALGRTDNIVAQLEAHRECERALIEQKAALARVEGTP